MRMVYSRKVLIVEYLNQEEKKMGMIDKLQQKKNTGNMSETAKKVALEVAKEHYAFTPDRVDQGTATGTLSEVAASIAVSKGWFFWWD